MQPKLPQEMVDARNHILAAMGSLAKAMVADRRFATDPVNVLIADLSRSVAALDRITQPF